MREFVIGAILLFTSYVHIFTASTIKKDSCNGCLFLTPFIKNGSTSEARKLSLVDPDPFLGVISHSGFITVKEVYNSNLFFWFFPVEDMKNKPWIIWLQGGPGCSSLLGLFELIGPLEIEECKVKLRNLTWASDYSLLFLDQPVGTGFSFTDEDRGYTSNIDEVGAQMYDFLQQFLEIFPELREAPLFVSGESYGGKYIPALGIHIHRNKKKDRPINIRGFTIGNGLIDPRSMALHYSDLCSAVGILDGDEITQLQDLEESLVQLIDEEKLVDASNVRFVHSFHGTWMELYCECLPKFNETIEYIKKHSGVDIFNFNKNPDHSPHAFLEFLKRPDVRSWIHAGNASFDFDNQLVYEKMLPDIMNTSKPFVEELLEHYGVLSYSGQLDIMVAYSLSKHTYNLLHWSGREKYLNAPRKKLRKNGPNTPIVGYKKAGGNFWDVLIRESGHMVPKEQPQVLKYIIDCFVKAFK